MAVWLVINTPLHNYSFLVFLLQYVFMIYTVENHSIIVLVIMLIIIFEGQLEYHLDDSFATQHRMALPLLNTSTQKFYHPTKCFLVFKDLIDTKYCILLMPTGFQKKK